MAQNRVLNFSLTLACAFALASCNAAEPQDGYPDAQEADKVAAAQQTATTNSSCTAIAPFYWEIGNVDSILASGTTGDGSVTRTTNMRVGSATKWLFGAYVIQQRGGAPTSQDVPYLTMTAGYNDFGNFSCDPNMTVNDCFSASNGNGGLNSDLTSADVGKFYYNGGHFQAWAVNLGGLGSNGITALSTKFRASLGSNTGVTFTSPQLAGGASMNAGGYVEFLRRIITGQLLIKNYLGAGAVCTLPGSPNCNAESTPLDTLAFHYSYGHWVEDDPAGDGSFSSAGIFGFYPWIDKTKRYYGVLARFSVYSGSSQIGNGYASYLCGKAIRKAYLSGTAQ